MGAISVKRWLARNPVNGSSFVRGGVQAGAAGQGNFPSQLGTGGVDRCSCTGTHLRVLLGSEINLTLGISNEGKDLGFL